MRATTNTTKPNLPFSALETAPPPACAAPPSAPAAPPACCPAGGGPAGWRWLAAVWRQQQPAWACGSRRPRHPPHRHRSTLCLCLWHRWLLGGCSGLCRMWQRVPSGPHCRWAQPPLLQTPPPHPAAARQRQQLGRVPALRTAPASQPAAPAAAAAPAERHPPPS